MKIFIRVLLFLFLFTLIISISGYFYFLEQLKPVGGNKRVEVVVPEGASGIEVAKLFKDKGLIKNELVFRFLIRQKKSRMIQFGKFVFNTNQNLEDIISSLDNPVQEILLTTVPEGLTNVQTAELLAQKGLVSEERFLEILCEYKFFINGKPLQRTEGYLFPETYNFLPEHDAIKIAKLMIAQFDERCSPLYNMNKNSTPVKLTLDEAVVLASLVEREAQIPSERPVIAGVYYNRLKKNMLLECDATVQYALGKQKEVLLYKDLEIDSPYNTYKYPGLPPGAIANPGFDSFKAVMKPVSHKYLYYVRDDVKNDGSHVFSTSFAEHQRAILKYQK